MAIKALIWDFAGVLLHTVEGDFNSLLSSRLGVPISEIERVFSTQENNLWDLGEMEDEAFFAFVTDELHLPEEKRITLARHFVDDFYVQPALLDYIRDIRKKYTTVLLTNFPRHLHTYLKTDWFIEGAFDYLIASCDVKLIKPDPRMYQYTLDKIGCSNDEVVFIDDRPMNLEGAEKLGIRSLLYRDTPQIIADLEKIFSTDVVEIQSANRL